MVKLAGREWSECQRLSGAEKGQEGQKRRTEIWRQGKGEEIKGGKERKLGNIF